jgi:Fe-S-cluster-containing dehydrogenase component
MSRRYGLVIDLDRCTGCLTCIVACQTEHNLEKISGIRVETIGGQGRDTPAGTYPNFSMHYLPIPCMHCTEPPCIPSCPSEAIYHRQDGIVLVDEAKCDGCLICIEACPYEALTHKADTNTVWKCTFCSHRVDEGEVPFCVDCCEMFAMFFGDIDDPSTQVSQWAEQRNAYVHKPELNTNPNVRYCRPRDKRL